MNTQIHRFTIGRFQCIIVPDGTNAYPHPAALFFANAPQVELTQALRAHQIVPAAWEQYLSPYPSLVIDTGQARVLVDTGAGNLAPTTGELLPNLRAVGIEPESIDTVILTHGHADHIGGAATSEGAPAFPRARYVMWQSEWEFWSQNPDLSSLHVPDWIKTALVDVAQRNLPPIAGRVDLVSRESEIVPGICAIAAPGHTLGHMALSIFSQGEHLLHLVDTVLHPIHMEHPEWTAAVDLLPEQTVITRRHLLARGRGAGAGLCLPFPVAGFGTGGCQWGFMALGSDRVNTSSTPNLSVTGYWPMPCLKMDRRPPSSSTPCGYSKVGRLIHIQIGEKMSIQLRILFGSTVLVALTTFGITLAEAFGPLPGSTSAFVSSINLDGGLSEIETHPNPGNPLQTTVVQSGTISITTYPPLGTMTITTTQRFSGAFPPSPMFDPCSNASGLFFSSTGGTCILNALTQRINCPTGITTFAYSYSCTFVPDVNAGKVSVSLAADWTGSAIDRTWDFSYSPLIYHSAAVPPDLSTSQTLRWTQIDGASVSLDILFVDPRVSLEFLPLVRK